MDLRAVIFVPALVGCVIFGFLFAVFAAHYYLTVLQSTGSGARQVTWVSEPLIDNLWKVFYLAWLIGLWFGPAWVLGRGFAAGTDAAWAKYVVPMLVLWVCYPVSQLSSLSGPTIWLPLHHDVFGRLARKPAIVLSFLALSGITLAAIGLAFHLTFSAAGLEWLFLGSVMLVVTALLYARLLGRLAYVLMYTRSILSRRKKKKPKPSDAPHETQDNREVLDDAESVGFAQPSDLPPIQTPDEGPLTGYDVKFEDAPKRTKRIVAEVAECPTEPKRPAPAPLNLDDADDHPYGVSEPEVVPDAPAPVDIVKPSAMEMRLLSRDDAPKPPKQAWTAELVLFLAEPGTLAVIGLLTVLCVSAGGMVRIARYFNPTAGES